MPMQLQISPLHRLLVVVARGRITVDEVRDINRQMAEAKVRHYGKIVDVSGATIEASVEEVQRIAAELRGPASDVVRGPLACVVDPVQHGFAEDFAAATEDDRPIKLFRSLHEARRWLQQTMDEEQRSGRQRSSGPRQPSQ